MMCIKQPHYSINKKKQVMKNYKKLQSSKELMKLLNFHGWKVVAVKGSHYQFKHHEIKGRVTYLIQKICRLAL